MGAEAIEQGPIGAAVAENVRLRRAQLRLSQRELAVSMSEAGRPRHATAVAKIEAGERRVDVDDLVALAVALKTSVAQLLTPPLDGQGQVRVTAAVVLPPQEVRQLLTGSDRDRIMAKVARAHAVTFGADPDIEDRLDEMERALAEIRVSVQHSRAGVRGEH